jgi:Mlc titration factor MtfA (ptsG expression regulator)
MLNSRAYLTSLTQTKTARSRTRTFNRLLAVRFIQQKAFTSAKNATRSLPSLKALLGSERDRLRRTASTLIAGKAL